MRTRLIFYQHFTWPLNAVNLVVASLFLFYPASQAAAFAFWSKVFSTALVFGYFHLFHRDQFYFYHNLGLSTRALYTSTFMLDTAVCLVLSFISCMVPV